MKDNNNREKHMELVALIAGSAALLAGGLILVFTVGRGVFVRTNSSSTGQTVQQENGTSTISLIDDTASLPEPVSEDSPGKTGQADQGEGSPTASTISPVSIGKPVQTGQLADQRKPVQLPSDSNIKPVSLPPGSVSETTDQGLQLEGGSSAGASASSQIKNDAQVEITVNENTVKEDEEPDRTELLDYLATDIDEFADTFAPMKEAGELGEEDDSAYRGYEKEHLLVVSKAEDPSIIRINLYSETEVKDYSILGIFPGMETEAAREAVLERGGELYFQEGLLEEYSFGAVHVSFIWYGETIVEVACGIPEEAAEELPSETESEEEPVPEAQPIVEEESVPEEQPAEGEPAPEEEQPIVEEESMPEEQSAEEEPAPEEEQPIIGEEQPIIEEESVPEEVLDSRTEVSGYLGTDIESFRDMVGDMTPGMQSDATAYENSCMVVEAPYYGTNIIYIGLREDDGRYCLHGIYPGMQEGEAIAALADMNAEMEADGGVFDSYILFDGSTIILLFDGGTVKSVSVRSPVEG